MEYSLNDPAKILQELPAMALPFLHGFIVLWGLLDCFFGFRIFRATVKILMAFALALVGSTVAMRIVPGSTPVFLTATCIGLILGFIVGWYLYKTGIVAMALFGGFVLAAPFAVTMGANAIFVQCGVAVAAAVLTFFLLEPVVIASTALTGAFRVVFGVLFFRGGASIMDYVTGAKSYENLVDGMGQIPLVITLLLAAVGGFAQFSAWRGEKKKKSEEEE